MFYKQASLCIMSATLLIACAGSPSTPDDAHALRAAEVNTRLGIQYLRTGEYDMSRKRLEKAIRQAPGYAGAHDAIAVLYERVGERELAEKHYLKGLRLDPDNASSHNNYGQFLCQSKRFDEAEHEFELAANNPFYRSPWVPLTNAGTCYFSVPDIEKAEKYLRLALKQQPEYAPALLKMGMVSFAAGNYLATRAYVQRYQQVADHSAESLWLAIRAEFELKDHQAWGNYALQLKNGFPDSEQTLLLQEWENERRSGN